LSAQISRVRPNLDFGPRISWIGRGGNVGTWERDNVVALTPRDPITLSGVEQSGAESKGLCV